MITESDDPDGDGWWGMEKKTLLWEVGQNGDPLLGDTFFGTDIFVARTKIPFTFKYKEHV